MRFRTLVVTHSYTVGRVRRLTENVFPRFVLSREWYSRAIKLLPWTYSRPTANYSKSDLDVNLKSRTAIQIQFSTVQCWVTSCNVHVCTTLQTGFLECPCLRTNCPLSYICESTQAVSQGPSHFLSLSEWSGIIYSKQLPKYTTSYDAYKLIAVRLV